MGLPWALSSIWQTVSIASIPRLAGTFAQPWHPRRSQVP